MRNLAAIANPHAKPFAHMHCDPGNTCRYVLPGTVIKSQKYLADRAGGTTLDLGGYGLLAGSKVSIASKSAVVDTVSSSSISLAVPSGLSTGWQDIWITHPNSNPIWLANAVLLVDDLFGDTDHDGLSDQWEWDHGFDPLINNPADTDTGALGDADKDGLSNLVEEAFSPMQLDPNRPDTQLMPKLKLENDRATFDYSVDRRGRINVRLEYSQDLVHWLKPGDTGYPSGMQAINLGTGTGDTDNLRIDIPMPQGSRQFFRWSVDRQNP